MKKRQLLRYRLSLALGAAVLLPALMATPALAHDALESTSPAADATVSLAPTTVSLTLSKPPTDSDSLTLSIITVTDGEGKTVSDGKVVIQGPTLSTAITSGSAGKYKVLWRAVSSDGHPVEGDYTFTVEDQGAAGKATTFPATTAPVSGIEASADGSDAADQPKSSNNGRLTLAIGIPAAILAAAIGTLIIVRRQIGKSNAS